VPGWPKRLLRPCERVTTSAILFLTLAFGLVLMAPPGFVLHWLFLRRLRTEHGETWHALGRPSPIFYGSISTALSVQRFIRRAEYERLDDPRFSRFCSAYRLFAVVYTALFAAMLVAFSLALLEARPRVIELPPSNLRMVVSVELGSSAVA
jgi:hypothetical protein